VPGGYARAERVVFFLIDGFGMDAALAAIESRRPSIGFLAREGLLSALTSQFPSTTVVHAVTMHSGLQPGMAGVLEWYYREPKLGGVIAPFLMRRVPPAPVDAEDPPFGADEVFPEPIFLRGLADSGVACFCYSSSAFTPSAFSERMAAPATVVPFESLDACMAALAANASLRGPAYHYVYLDLYDAIEHRHGPGSEEALAELDRTLLAVSRAIEALPPGSLALVSADHGHMGQDPLKARYLDILAPRLVELLERDRFGRPMIAAGGLGRTAFLHLLPGADDEARKLVQEAIGDAALPMGFDELIAMRAFGDGPLLPDLRERAGDLVLLSKAGETAWWSAGGSFEIRHLGNHGGMTRAEMEIPLFAVGT
jgi:hypothetical protein